MRSMYGYASMQMLLATFAAMHPDRLYQERMRLESESSPPQEVVAARLTKAEKKRERKNKQRLKLQPSGGTEHG